MDGEDTTLVVTDTWEAEKLVWHSKQHLGGGAMSLVADSCPLLGHYRAGAILRTPQNPWFLHRLSNQCQKNLMTLITFSHSTGPLSSAI